jgi:hypothetical protein
MRHQHAGGRPRPPATTRQQGVDHACASTNLLMIDFVIQGSVWRINALKLL